jgi:hypothetical protein
VFLQSSRTILIASNNCLGRWETRFGLRNLVIERLEEADAECAASRWLLDLMRVSLCGYLI